MKLRSLIILSLFSAAPLLGQSVDMPPREPAPASDSSPGTSSRELRRSKVLQITLGAGLLPSTYLGGDVHAAIFLGAMQQLTLGYAQGVDRQPPESVKAGRLQSFGIGHRLFFGNSFYEHLEITQQTLTRTSKASDDESVSLKNLCGSIALGNQWQWRTLTFGVDWIGVLASLKRSRIEEEEEEGRVLNPQLVAEVDTLDEDTKGVHALSRIYFGFSF